MATNIEHISSDDIAQSIKTAELEQAYHQSLRAIERIYEEDRARELRVQILILEDANDDLQTELDKYDGDVEELEDDNADLRDQLADVETELSRVQMDLKAQHRDLEHVRAEVTALNATSTDATKILLEKLSLARQLSTLKPELEHLKSQTTNQQNVLAEKLTLQREISAMQVELDTEKRAVYRLKSQGKASGDEESALAAEIDDLKKELAKTKKVAMKSDKQATEVFELKAELERLKKEAQQADKGIVNVDELRKELTKVKKDAQKTEKEQIKKTSDWDNQKETMEGKLDAFRNKLRSTKEQLREAQEELENARLSKMAQSAELTKARMVGNTAPPAANANPKKRSVARFDPDATIGTPGHGASKKQRTSVNVSDKSTVSMTPFFNKTVLSILPESPVSENGDAVDKAMNETINEIVEEADKTEKAKKAPPKQKPAPKKPAPKKASQPLKESTTKANAVVKKPVLPKVIEEDEDEEQENNENTAPTENAEPVKKKVPSKRPNIFDDDDAPAPKIKSLKGGGLGNVSLLGFSKGKTKTLAEFSPLKKDRRS